MNRLALFALLLALPQERGSAPSTPLRAGWTRRTIDGTSKGADGVRLADANGDGLPDIVTGWEQGGQVKAYLHPGRDKSKRAWPSVLVGQCGSVEDAVWADVDGDGALDVVSSCEGNVRSVFVSWAPSDRARLLDPAAWTCEVLPASRGLQQWMFAVPMQIDGKHGLDIVAGGKNKGAQLGWFRAPADPRKLADWTWEPICDAGWIMTIAPRDMDGDGDLDIVYSDRKGPRRGCRWLENPGWKSHEMGAADREAMFMTFADLDGDGLEDALVAVKPDQILHLRRMDKGGLSWETHASPLPLNAGSAKGVAVGDLDLDGAADVVFTCEGAGNGKSGVMWLKRDGAGWRAREISGSDGVKHDLVELIDLDGDGDLDVLTCEETTNLGVIWYENPLR